MYKRGSIGNYLLVSPTKTEHVELWADRSATFRTVGANVETPETGTWYLTLHKGRAAEISFRRESRVTRFDDFGLSMKGTTTRESADEEWAELFRLSNVHSPTWAEDIRRLSK